LWRLNHKQKPYLQNQSYQIENAEFYEKNLINIPCSSNLSEGDVEAVIKQLDKNRRRTE